MWGGTFIRAQIIAYLPTKGSLLLGLSDNKGSFPNYYMLCLRFSRKEKESAPFISLQVQMSQSFNQSRIN